MLTSEREALVIEKRSNRHLQGELLDLEVPEKLENFEICSLQEVYGEKFGRLEQDWLEDLKNERNSVGPALDDP